MRNYFTFGEYDSREFGVYIARDGVYNSPRKVYNSYAVPGRNGDLHISQNRLENIEVIYPACIYAGFDANLTDLRNALMSQDGYVRITDSYHPYEYRLGVYKGDMTVIPTVLGDGGTFDIVFDCMPQRFLLSGDEPVIVTANGIVTNPTLFHSKPVIRVRFDDTSKNLIQMPYSNVSPYAHNGITYTTLPDGSVRAVGTCGSARSVFSFRAYNDFIHLPEGHYHFECTPPGGSQSTYYTAIWYRYNSAQVGTSRYDYGSGVDFDINAQESLYDAIVQIYIQPGVTIDKVFSPILFADSDEVVLSIGSDRIHVENRYDFVDIDCESQDCHHGIDNANPYVRLQNGDFPKLKPGENNVVLGAGIDSLEITPRWYQV